MDNIIRVKVMCLLPHEGKILLSQGLDSVTGQNFYRVLGGTLNFREKSEDGIRREIREELGSELKNLKLLEVIENNFTYNGQPGHQLVFLFQGELENSELFKKEIIHIVENEYEFDAMWVPVSDVLSRKVILCPALDWSKYLDFA